MIIIPAIDIQSGRCVRLTQGRMDSAVVYANDPIEMAHHWAGQGAQRLHVVDLDGALAGEPKNHEIIGEIVKSVQIPVEVGGGIRTQEIADFYIKSGVMAIILGTKAADDSHFIASSCSSHPGRVYVSIDAMGSQVMAEGWTRGTNRAAHQLASEMIEAGVSAIIYTDIQRDGTLSGPNVEAIGALARNVDVPVIASGGVSRMSDIQALMGLRGDGVSGVIIGKALYTGAIDLKEALSIARSSGFEK